MSADKQQNEEHKQQNAVPERWGTSSAAFFADMEGETINVHLRSGQALSGVLTGVDRYDIFLERSDGKVAMIPKHAIEWIEMAG